MINKNTNMNMAIVRNIAYKQIGKINKNIKEIIVVVTIHLEKDEEKIDFSSVSGCYCRIWDQESGKELCRFTLSDDFSSYSVGEPEANPKTAVKTAPLPPPFVTVMVGTEV